MNTENMTATEVLEARTKLNTEIFDLLAEVKIQHDKFTRAQLAEAVRQAIECGDFVQYVVAGPPINVEDFHAWQRMLGAEPPTKFKFEMRTLVTYLPFQEAERLRAKIDNARRLEWVEDTDEGGGFWAQTPFHLYTVRPYLGDAADEEPWGAFVPDEDGVGRRTADEAKAYAERDWARRVDALLGGAL